MKKRILSFLLAASMILVNVPATTFAASASADDTYEVYAAVGDSIPAGYGTDSWKSANENYVYNITNSPAECYPQRVKSALGNTTYNLGHLAYCPDNIQKTITDPSDDLYDDYTKAIKEADLVSYQSGSNYLIKSLFKDMFTALGADPSLVNDDMIINCMLGATTADLTKMLANFTAVGIELDAKTMIKMMTWLSKKNINAAFEKGYQEFTKEIGGSIQAVKKVNDDATFAVLNYYNPYKGTMSEEDMAELRQMLIDAIKEYFKNKQAALDAGEDESSFDDNKAMSQIIVRLGYPLMKALMSEPTGTYTVKMNAYLEDYCDTNDILFVDVADIDTKTTMDPHPTKNGHQQIADRLIDAVLNDVSVSVSEGGTVTARDAKQDSYVVKYDNYITFTIIPDEGYEVDVITVNGEEVSPMGRSVDTEITVDNVRDDVSVEVSFKKSEEETTEAESTEETTEAEETTAAEETEETTAAEETEETTAAEETEETTAAEENEETTAAEESEEETTATEETTKADDSEKETTANEETETSDEAEDETTAAAVEETTAGGNASEESKADETTKAAVADGTNGNGTSSGSGTQASATGAVNTGDSANPFAYMFTAFSAVVLMIAANFVLRNKNNR